MEGFLKSIYEQAKRTKKRIAFTDPNDERILQAIARIINESIAEPILVGNEQEVKQTAQKLGIELNRLQIIDPQKSELTAQFKQAYAQIKQNHGHEVTEEILNRILQTHYFGTMLVHMDLADGMITGATHSTGESIHAALEIIPTEEKFHRVSGAFLMKLEDRLLLFADTAVTIDPDAHDLAEIAEDTVETARVFGIEPKVAFLSFSTKGSADHALVEKIVRATKIFQDQNPDIPADGELQADAALVPDVARRKSQESRIQGDANILIFPDLNAANIAYKLVERLAKARAVGPILQGLQKPINDLSRVCSVQDIVDLTAITAVEAQRNS